MKKILWFAAILLLLFSACGPGAQEPEKTLENGTEVVINRLEPYKIRGREASLELKKEFSIDFSREELAGLGLADIYNFNVDTAGNIYVLNAKPVESFIFMFDKSGHFCGALGRKAKARENSSGPHMLPSTIRPTSSSLIQRLEKTRFLIHGEL